MLKQRSSEKQLYKKESAYDDYEVKIVENAVLKKQKN